MDFGAALIGLVISMFTKVIIMAWAFKMILKSYKSLHQSPTKRPWLLVPASLREQFRPLYWSLIFFFISELVCGIEVYIVMQTSELYRAFHAFSSAIGMGLFALGIYQLIDDRILQYGTNRCVINRVCQGCTVIKGKKCEFQASILIAATFLLLASIPPQFAETSWMQAEPQRWLLPFPTLNSWYDTVLVPWLMNNVPGYKPIGAAFFLPTSTQIIDMKILPAIAGVMALVGGIIYWKGSLKNGIKLIVLSTGPLAYSYYELILNRVTGDLFLGALGHEIGEFLFLVLIAEILTRFFPIEAPIEAMVSDKD